MQYTMKQRSLFLFASLFAVAMLHPASAQPGGGPPGGPSDATDNHSVTINVDNIDEISVDGSPTITINSGELNTWVEGDGDGSFTVTSNAKSARKITISSASAVGPGNSQLAHLGLRVKAESLPGSGSEAYSGAFELLSKSGNAFNTGDFITGFKGVHGTTTDLTYEANASESYDPSKTTEIEVEYTLTASGGN